MSQCLLILDALQALFYNHHQDLKKCLNKIEIPDYTYPLLHKAKEATHSDLYKSVNLGHENLASKSDMNLLASAKVGIVLAIHLSGYPILHRFHHIDQLSIP